MTHSSASQSIDGRPANRLPDRYWTDRDCRGEFDFDQHRDGLPEDFESAAKLFCANRISRSPKAEETLVR